MDGHQGIIVGWAGAVVLTAAACGSAACAGAAASRSPTSTPQPGFGILVAAVTPTPSPVRSTPRPAGYVFEDWRLAVPLNICVNEAGGPATTPSLLEIVRESVQQWDRAAGVQLPLHVTGICSAPPEPGDGLSVVGWQPMKDAAGWARVRQRKGVVTGADIVLDPVQATRGGPICLHAIVLHELGHVLGLDHQEDASSIMFPVTHCITVLSPRDVAAVSYLYRLP